MALEGGEGLGWTWLIGSVAGLLLGYPFLGLVLPAVWRSGEGMVRVGGEVLTAAPGAKTRPEDNFTNCTLRIVQKIT